MTSRTAVRSFFAASVLGLLAASASAEKKELTLQSNTVVAAVSEAQLSLKNSRVGDEFSARIDNDRDLPQGTRAEGRVVDVRQKRGTKSGEMLLEFNRIVLPDGTRQDIRAVPIAWNDRYLTKGGDGRMVAKPNIPRDKYVIGGLAGGLLIGSMVKKPFEGAFIGILAGILMAESDNAQNGDVVIRRGDKIGVLIEKDVTLTWDTRDDLRNGENRAQDADRQEPSKQAELEIAFNDQVLRFDRSEQPFEAGRVVMVPLQSAAKQLGMSAEIGSNRDLILIEGEKGIAKLDRGSREYRFNEEHKTLSRNLIEKDGVLYIPLEVLKLLTGGTLKVNGTKLEDYE